MPDGEMSRDQVMSMKLPAAAREAEPALAAAGLTGSGNAGPHVADDSRAGGQ